VSDSFVVSRSHVFSGSVLLPFRSAPPLSSPGSCFDHVPAYRHYRRYCVRGSASVGLRSVRFAHRI